MSALPTFLEADEIAALRALLDAATPGPWETLRMWPMHIVPASEQGKPLGAASSPQDDRRYAQSVAEVKFDWITVRDFPAIAAEFPHRRVHEEVCLADAALIAAAVTALPRLLAQVESQRAQVAELVGHLNEALEELASAGHVILESGYCATCEGGCLVGFTNPPAAAPLVEPSPFAVKGL